jgi:uncharacterized membrane protein YhaH (DUF805 family)
MFCNHCGTENSDSGKFCQECGKKVLARTSFQWKQYLFSAKGRINRKLYLAMQGFTIVALILVDVIEEALGIGPPRGGIIVLLLFLVTLFPLTVIAIKRLHDLNVSGWFVLIIYWIELSAVAPSYWSGARDSGALIAWGLLNYAVIVLLLGSKRGTGGPNQYGPDPLLTSSEQPGNNEAPQP